MHGNEVFQRVRHALAQVEAERNVRVLFACESGSRAWGFASRDSDYDVRFLYVHRRDWYLSVEDRRDVIEQPIADDLDVSGWELRKALRLLRKSNPPLLEWLKSPVVYRHDPVYVRGTVRHSDHATLTLRGWHTVWMNTETATRQMANVAFLD